MARTTKWPMRRARRWLIGGGGLCSVVVLIASCSSPLSGTVDLRPVSLSFAGSAVKAGTPFPASVTIDNSGSASATKSFTVNFYLSTSSSFVPTSSDTPDGTATVTTAISAGGSTVATGSVTLKTLAANGYEYLYAWVDPNNVTGDANTSNNITTASEAVKLYAYKSATLSYTLNIDTFDPTTGSNSSTTVSTNPVLALWTASGSGLKLASTLSGSPYAWNNSSGTFNNIASVQLSAGTYYLGIQGAYASGAYGIGACDSTGSYSPTTFPTALSSAAALPTNNASTTITMPTSTPTTGQTISAVPTNTVALKLGTALNWYVASNTTDWFTITLP